MKRNRTTEEFIQESKEIHGEKYEYLKSEYSKRKSKVIITCKIHGDFNQTACSHLSGSGCDKCAHDKLDNRRRKNIGTFINESNEIHKNHFNYSKVNYINWNTKVEILCPSHGSFFQSPHNHIKGHGCNKCRGHVSKPEIEITKFIKSIYNGSIINNNRNILKPKEIDIYLPELNLAFEFNGEYWHSLSKNKNGREDKTYNCMMKGITLIHIEDVDWKKNKKMVLQNIKELITE